MGNDLLWPRWGAPSREIARQGFRRELETAGHGAENFSRHRRNRVSRVAFDGPAPGGGALGRGENNLA
jgi:hypothetical protein